VSSYSVFRLVMYCGANLKPMAARLTFPAASMRASIPE
jgi:hypothetical protein